MTAGESGPGTHPTPLERQEQIEELRQVVQAYSFLFLRPADALMVWELDGTVRNANEAACMLTGLDRGKLLGFPCMELFPSFLRPALTDILVRAEVEPDGTILADLITSLWRKSPGEGVPVMLRVSPITRPEGRKLFCILHDLRDLTELKAQQEAAAAARAAELQSKPANPPAEAVATPKAVSEPQPEEEEKIPIDELKARADSMRREYTTSADMSIRSGGKVKQLSLPYYSVPNGASVKENLLDLEQFVAIHRAVINGALKMTEKLYKPEDKSTRLAILRKAHKFLLSLYSNARAIISPGGNSKLLPYAGEQINESLIFDLEVLLSMQEWESAADLESFNEIMNARLEWPLKEILATESGRRKYLESIVFA